MKQITGAGWLKDINDNFAAVDPKPATTYFVDTFNGSDNNNGQSFENAFATMTKALATVTTGGKIYFVGDVREECIASNLVFDVTIEGAGSLHHPDQPSSAYNPGASMWRPPASPTTATSLLKVRGRGWKFKNIVFDCPVDAAALEFVNNAGSGLTEYDGGHASVIDCLFRSGQYGIHINNTIHNLLVDGCEFFLMNNGGGTGCAIFQTTSGGPNLPLKNTIRNCTFAMKTSAGANDRHIIMAGQGNHIYNNFFGTVTGTGKYIDLTGGNDNAVYNNIFGGAYDTDDYVSGTNDVWLNNWVAVKATTAPDGHTLAVPAGP